MFQKLFELSFSLSLVVLTSADITWPLHSQQCRDDAGPLFVDDEETFGPGGKYHDGSAAYPQLLEDGSCAKPLQGACASRDDKKSAYLEGPIDCGNKGWYCRIYNDEENGWANINLVGDYNFGNCNSTSSFEDAGYDRDGHCHGSSVDNTYYWWIRDHWYRQYNGRVRCCCGWYEGGTQPLFSGRIANRCDYRRLVTETENLDNCRDANEGHNLGYDDIGCDASYQSSQLNSPIPEDDDVCWEIQRFGFTEEGGSPPTPSPDAPSPVASPTTDSPIASPSTSSPVSVPTTSAPVSSPVNDEDEDPEEAECVDSPLDFLIGGKVRTCNWAGNGNSAKRCAKSGVAKHCPLTCGKCDEFKCADSGRRFILEENGKKKRCGFFANNPSRCDRFDYAIETCRGSCSYCG